MSPSMPMIIVVRLQGISVLVVVTAGWDGAAA